MRKAELKNGEKVSSPWLRVDAAAVYCGISRSTFVKYAGENLPHGGDGRTKLYKISILDAWISNELDIPFNPKQKLPGRRRRNPINLNDDEETSFNNPSSGRIHRIKEKK